MRDEGSYVGRALRASSFSRLPLSLLSADLSGRPFACGPAACTGRTSLFASCVQLRSSIPFRASPCLPRRPRPCRRPSRRRPFGIAVALVFLAVRGDNSGRCSVQIIAVAWPKTRKHGRTSRRVVACRSSSFTGIGSRRSRVQYTIYSRPAVSYPPHVVDLRCPVPL